MKKIADAADPLYKTLDDGQKRRLAILTHMERRFGRGEWRNHAPLAVTPQADLVGANVRPLAEEAHRRQGLLGPVPERLRVEVAG